MGNENDPQPLHYAPLPPRWRRRGFRWVVGLIVASGSAAAWLYGPRAIERAKVLYYQQACMAFTAPPETVVYDRMPNISSKTPMPPRYMNSMQSVRVIQFKSSQSGNNNCLALTPVCCQKYSDALNQDLVGPDTCAVVFLHERTSRAGTVRLVVIGVPADSYLSAQMFEPLMSHGTVASATFNTTPVVHLDGISFNGGGPASVVPGPQRVFAGQPDLQDASHFTIEYQWQDGVHGFIDGWLQDDGTIKTLMRPGPGDVISEVKRRYPGNG